MVSRVMRDAVVDLKDDKHVNDILGLDTDTKRSPTRAHPQPSRPASQPHIHN